MCALLCFMEKISTLRVCFFGGGRKCNTCALLCVVVQIKTVAQNYWVIFILLLAYFAFYFCFFEKLLWHHQKWWLRAFVVPPRGGSVIVALNDCVSGRNRDTGCCLESFEMSDVIDECVCFVTSHYFAAQRLFCDPSVGAPAGPTENRDLKFSLFFVRARQTNAHM